MTNSGNTASIPGPEPLADARARMWQAVILRAVEEWLSGPERLRRQAEHYLFEDRNDFPSVCELAGMDAGRLRARLAKFRGGAQAAAAMIAANRAVRVNAVTQIAMRAASEAGTNSAASHRAAAPEDSDDDGDAPAARPQAAAAVPGHAAKRASAA